MNIYDETNKVQNIIQSEQLYERQSQVVRDAIQLQKLALQDFKNNIKSYLSIYDYLEKPIEEAQKELEIKDKRRKKPNLDLLQSHIAEDFFDNKINFKIKSIAWYGWHKEAVMFYFDYNGDEYCIEIPLKNNLDYDFDTSLYGKFKVKQTSKNIIEVLKSSYFMEDIKNYILQNIISVTKQSQPSLPIRATLSEYTWSELKQLSTALVNGTLTKQDLISVHNISPTNGATKFATINGEKHPFRVVGVLHDFDDSGNRIGLTFEQVDLLNNDYAMKSNMSDSDNWANSDLIITLNNFTIENDLDAVITPARKVCCNSVSRMCCNSVLSNGAYNQTNKLWIMSETEIENSQARTCDGTVEGIPYEYYTNEGYTDNGRIKNQSESKSYYWLRSHCAVMPTSMGIKSYFALVDFDGNVSFDVALDHWGVAACFCI